MQELRVLGVEDGGLVVAAEDGTRFRVPIDEALQSRLRLAVPDQGTARKLAPKEIQAHIRAGMSADDVAAVTGASLEYIRRFEGPVLAERQFVIDSALGVPVHTAADPDPLGEGLTFGTAIRERLHDLSAIDERWASWKDPAEGWLVKLSFTADDVEHDARWQFDPKRQSLSPVNNEAVALSQQGSPGAPLIPRLRAVPAEQPEQSSRFDSGAFAIDENEGTPTAPIAEPVRLARRTEEPVGNQTADLLEALRRRRGEREAAVYDEDEQTPSQAPASLTAVDVPLGDFPVPSSASEDREDEPAPAKTSVRRGRAAMPSWDEIVFGARSDDDQA